VVERLGVWFVHPLRKLWGWRSTSHSCNLQEWFGYLQNCFLESG